MRRSSPAAPKPGRRKKPARISQVSSWSADVLRPAIQLSRAGQSERTRPAFHSLFAIPRICSSFLRSRVAVIKSRWLAERSEEHTSELQSRLHLVCRLLLEKKK